MYAPFRFSHVLAITIVLMAFLTKVSLVASDAPKTPSVQFLSEKMETLQKSRDPQELESAAILLAKSNDSKCIKSLATVLMSDGFVRRLEPVTSGPNYNVRLRRVIQEIGKSAAPNVETALLDLASDATSHRDDDRLSIVVMAMGEISKPSQKVIAFLESLLGSQKGGLRNIALICLAQLATPESCELIERLIVSDDFPISLKWTWLEYVICKERNKTEIVKLYRRLITNEKLDPEVTEEAIRTLFSFTPPALPGDTSRTPPPRSDASTDVLLEIIGISELVSRMDVKKTTKEDVEIEVRKIRMILRVRKEREDGSKNSKAK